MDDDFGKMIGQFGAMESAIGQELYQAQVKYQTATEMAMLARCRLMDSWAGAVNFAMVMAFLTLLPVMVWLWKWAL